MTVLNSTIPRTTGSGDHRTATTASADLPAVIRATCTQGVERPVRGRLNLICRYYGYLQEDKTERATVRLFDAPWQQCFEHAVMRRQDYLQDLAVTDC